MSRFSQIFPDVETLLGPGPEDVGVFTLRYLNNIPANQALHRYNFVSSAFEGELPSYGGTRLAQVQEVLSEGWAWLMREGLLVLSPGFF
jgi:hypothetical protein